MVVTSFSHALFGMVETCVRIWSGFFQIPISDLQASTSSSGRGSSHLTNLDTNGIQWTIGQLNMVVSENVVYP